ncbi:transglycosylase SLT domain-containing protein [Desulfobacula sp.]
MTGFCQRVLQLNFQSIRIILFLLFLCTPLCFATPTTLFAATSTKAQIADPLADLDFPSYPSIKPNVDFWIKIFAHTSKSQGVIHDNKNLGIIYEVVRLDVSNTARANRKNKKIKKTVAKKYKNILIKLSQGKKPISKEEKRIAKLFGSKAKPSDFKNAAFNIRCQTGLKQQFMDGLARSGAVIDKFKRTFLSHGLPVDLVYLPYVESSYNFKAYSKFGAAGIWQFTRSTGRRYMKINYVVDERRDPFISTDAAARLLKKNYAELKEWPLAITAYNHGLAGMRRAKNAKGSYEKIVKSYKSRSFKFASKNFYSEFLAARIVAKNPEKYFGKIKYQKPYSFKEIRTKGYLPVNDLAKALNLSLEEIQVLNPGLRKPVFNGQKYIPKGYRLKVPKNLTAPKINKKLTALYRDKQKPSRFHRVQKGDTAGSISRIHSVRLYDLILANGLNRRATIYIGQNLRIPVKDEIILAQKMSTTTKSKKTSKKIKVRKKKQVKSVPKPKEAPVNDAIAETIIAPGITEQLPLAKPLKSETTINPNIVTSNLKVLKTIQKDNATIGIIKVEAEETLGHYADWLGVPTQEIRALNKFKFGRAISIDQKIRIPMRKKTVTEFEELRYEFHKEIEEDFFESFSILGIDTYEVKTGDNIWNLSLNELEIPFWLIKKYNPQINFNLLKLSQKIKYPIISKL